VIRVADCNELRMLTSEAHLPGSLEPPGSRISADIVFVSEFKRDTEDRKAGIDDGFKRFQ
jgi:hypothetical protein